MDVKNDDALNEPGENNELRSVYFQKIGDQIECDIEKEPYSAIELLGVFIDTALDQNNYDVLLEAIQIGERILKSATDILDEKCLALLNYFLGNAYSEYGEYNEDFFENYTLNALYFFRKAIEINGLTQLYYTCALINYSNCLSLVGRKLEAIRWLKKALNKTENFSMALLNTGLCLEYISKAIYDDGHYQILNAYVYKNYKQALECSILPAYVKGMAQKNYKRYEPYKAHSENLIKEYGYNDFPGIEGKNLEYRKWCLRHDLFLNPLNTVISNDVSARDVFGLPSIVADVGDGPYYHSMYNNIVQEYVSARYMFFKGLHRDGQHFSDYDVQLYNTLDYPSLCYNNECVKVGFRTAYSLLDKIAYFINIYYDLNIEMNRVSFNNVWTKKTEKGKFEIRKEFRMNHNWAIKGLFWTSRELYEKGAYKERINEFSEQINMLRNFIEHKHLKIVDIGFERTFFKEPEGYAMTITRSDFEERVLTLFKLVRDSIMYLSMAVKHEEDFKISDREGLIIPSMDITLVDDEWKV